MLLVVVVFGAQFTCFTDTKAQILARSDSSSVCRPRGTRERGECDARERDECDARERETNVILPAPAASVFVLFCASKSL